MGDRIELQSGTVDLDARELRGAERVGLTPNEAKLLAYLARRANRVVPKDELLTEVFGYAPGTRSRTVFATIDRLRKKVERDPASPFHLVTIGRQGYTFRPLALEPAPAPPAPAEGSFVGRRAELARLVDALVPPALVTVRGPGGCGKTRLAREVLARTGHPGHHWCDLSEVATGAEAVAAIAAVVGVPLGREAEVGRHLRRLGRAMSAKEDALLVLDNADRVASELGALLEAWAPPRPAVLVTSRRALGAAGEQVLVLEPLPAPEAEALFVARARERSADWQPGTATREIVALLEGLPLAIELAARWSRVLPADALLERLAAHRLPLEAATDDPRPARHRTLEAALRGSWETLDPRLRRALAACSVFRGTFDAEGAEAVIGGPDALPCVEALIDRSLVQISGSRLRLLDAVRGFAGVRLQEDPAALSGARQRHAAWYARLGEPAAMRIMSGAAAALFGRLSADVPNLLAAVEHGDPEQAGRAALVVARIRRTTGPMAPVVPLLESVLARESIPAPLQARLWTALGVARRYDGDPERGLQDLEGALQLATALAPELRAGIEQALGTAYQEHRDSEQALPHLRCARDLYREAGDAYGEGVALAELASFELRAGRAEDATQLYNTALRLLRRADARQAEAIYLGNLAIAHMKRARYQAALEGFEASLALHRELGGERFEGQTLCNLGLLHVLWDRPDEGLVYYEQSLVASRRTGDRKDEGIALANMAWLRIQRGELSVGRGLLDQAQDIYEELQLPLHLADAALTRSQLHRAEGDLRAASVQLDRVAALVAKHDFGEVRVELAAMRGLVALDRGDPDQAATWLAQAEAAAASIDMGPTTDGGRLVAELQAALTPSG